MLRRPSIFTYRDLFRDVRSSQEWLSLPCEHRVITLYVVAKPLWPCSSQRSGNSRLSTHVETLKTWSVCVEGCVVKVGELLRDRLNISHIGDEMKCMRKQVEVKRRWKIIRILASEINYVTMSVCIGSTGNL